MSSASGRVHSTRDWRNSFVVYAGVLLGLTGAAKLLSATAATGIMAVHDPVFDIPFQPAGSGEATGALTSAACEVFPAPVLSKMIEITETTITPTTIQGRI